MLRCITFLMLAAAPIIGSGAARGGIILFTDRESFDAATTGRTSIDFEGIAADNNFVEYPAPPGLTLSGVNFTIQPGGGDLILSGKGFAAPGSSVVEATLFLTTAPNLFITLPVPETAVGLDLLLNASARVDLSTGESFTTASSFVGFTSTNPLTTLLITKTTITSFMDIDNFTFGTAATVPEPAGLTLAVIGLLVVPIYWLWRRVGRYSASRTCTGRGSHSPGRQRYGPTLK